MTHQNNIVCNYEIKKDFDSFSNKEIIFLVMNCEKCAFFYKDKKINFFDSNCFINLIKIFKENPKITKLTLNTRNGTFEFTNSQIELFSDYGQIQTRCSNLEFPNIVQRNRCSRSNECKNAQSFFIERVLGNKFNDGMIISNPILAYKEIIQEIKIYNQTSIERKECRACFRSLIHFLNEIRNLLTQTRIIKGFFSSDQKNRPLSEIYSLIFGDFNLITDSPKVNLNLPGVNEIIHCIYKKGPYKIKIVGNPRNNELFYEISSIIEEPAFKSCYVRIIQEIKSRLKEYFEYQKPYKLNYLLQYEKQYIIQLIKQNYSQFSEDQISNLAELIAFELLNLHPFMALLIDDEIEEIFLDSPQSFIYLDHRQFGRCQTRIQLTNDELESLKTRIRIEAEQRLDEMQPFLKTEVITDYFHIRIAIQIYPLSIDKFSMNIRKFHKKSLTLIDLIKNNTLSLEAASYLIFNLIHGRSILVIGEPYSGKTTLINSLDMVGKKNWRKIYIEDVIESIDQSAFGIHQVRFQVNSNEENSESYLAKSFQVKESLHRTPDEIFIGELIHRKSVESFFFLLKVGLRRSLATAHGESPELIVERFIFDDQIPSSIIENLDIIVQMNRINVGGRIIRRVTRITETKKAINTSSNKNVDTSGQNFRSNFMNIFLRDSKLDLLLFSFSSLNEFYEKSDIIQTIVSMRSENLSQSDFIMEFEKIKANLENLIKADISEVGAIISKFHSFWQELDGIKEIDYNSNYDNGGLSTFDNPK